MKGRQFLMLAIWLGLVFATRTVTFNIPIGEQSAHLGCFAIILPAVICLFPSRMAFLFAGGVWLVLHAFNPLPLTAGIPTLFAALSWHASKTRGRAHFAVHVLIPLSAMALFVLSGVGRGAWPYSLYWLIPVACAFLPLNLFTRALQSTFLQHAAGSVIWVYLVPLTSEQWLALIPVVAVERLLAASLAVGVIGCLTLVARRSKQQLSYA